MVARKQTKTPGSELPPVERIYSGVLADISKLYEDTLGMSPSERNRVLVITYWQIGRRIVEVEQGGRVSAKYGAQILKQLSQDLSDKFGDGFSMRNLFYIRRFSVTYPKTHLEDPLSWSQYRALLGVRDDSVRAKLEAKIRKDGLVCRDLERLVRRANGKSFAIAADAGEALLVPRRGRLHLYRLEKLREGKKDVCYLDAGFSVKHRVQLEGLAKLSDGAVVTVGGKTARSADVADQSERFCYEGIVMRVVDGDTLVIRVNLGFDVFADHRLRLRGVDAAELGTAEGEKARRFVEKIMTPGLTVLLFTYGCDVYGRYLADVFYSDVDTILTPETPDGIFLNAQIISCGHAGFMKTDRWQDD